MSRLVHRLGAIALLFLCAGVLPVPVVTEYRNLVSRQDVDMVKSLDWIRGGFKR